MSTDRPVVPAADAVRTIAEIVRPPAARPALGSAPLVDDGGWLIGQLGSLDSLAAFMDRWCWHLVATGLPIARVIVTVGTLHPQQAGFGGRWRAADGSAAESIILHEIFDTADFQASPFPLIFERGEVVRERLTEQAAPRFSLLTTLQAAGMTDYLAMPLIINQTTRNALTFASDRRGGFSEADIARLMAIAKPLANVLEMRALRLLTRSLLDVYLGPKAGGRVLSGTTQRGNGEAIRAVVWASDLRNFTRLSDRLPGKRVIELLNRSFERQVAAIRDGGGEVLKFVGDGLIAIFPIDDVALAASACANALAAAQRALADAQALNAELAAEADSPRLPLAISLHAGEVFFGNIGGVDRLDFTVIGPAVNAVSRLDKLAKTLERELLVTGDFVAASGHPGLFASLGVHPLRGLAEPVEVFELQPERERGAD